MDLFKRVDYYFKCLLLAACVRALAVHDIDGEEVGLAVVLNAVGVVAERAVRYLCACQVGGKARRAEKI